MYGARVERIVERLRAENLPALLVTSLPNIYYLSGFTGSTAMLLLSEDARYFITDFRYHEQVRQQVDPGFTMVDNTGKKLIEEVLPALPGQDALKRIGFEAGNLTYAQWAKFSQSGEREFVATESWIEELRQVKSADEIELIRRATLLGERVFTDLLALVGPDVTESDLAAELEYRARKLGAEGISFEPIIASGINSSKPHAGHSASKLAAAAPLTIDMGVKLHGYCSDMTRTVFYKDCPPRWEAIYNIVREAKDRALQAVKPGVLGKEVDAVAREYISRAGFGENFGHGLGHGLGIEVHESPTLSKLGEKALAPGHVLSDEPGIYIPGEGGVRIEDVFVVTEQGAENLNTLSTAIQVVG